MDEKNYTYIVKVIKTDFETEEDEIFEMEYEAEENESTSEACIKALDTALHGCVDED